MSVFDDLPDIIADALGDEFKAATLSVPGAPYSDGQGGFITSAPASHGCKALVADYSQYRRASEGIPANDRNIIILGATLPDGVIPAPGQSITVESRAWQIIAVTRDPAAATYELQGR